VDSLRPGSTWMAATLIKHSSTCVCASVCARLQRGDAKASGVSWQATGGRWQGEAPGVTRDSCVAPPASPIADVMGKKGTKGTKGTKAASEGSRRHLGRDR